MDSFLINYLKSGRAWLLVGSGPSTAMGYPSWQKLAAFTIEELRLENPGRSLRVIDAAMKHGDYPTVFEEARNIAGGPRLLQILKEKFVPSYPGEIYKMIAKWPVPVYLTTNYDDEIQKNIAALGETYIPYNNSEDHMSHLSPDLNGAVFKLHGDLRSETGLVLTSSDYKAISEAKSCQYWRTKLTSIFQLVPIVVIGHSLSDKNIRHVLKAAKEGAGVERPICWIAPDVASDQRREFLENYRIRVISYDNRDGQHKNLVQLIKCINAFIPPRTSVHISSQIKAISESPLGENAAAPGFFVFNKLLKHDDYEKKRIDVMVAAIQSVLPVLVAKKQFSLQMALELAGWPENISLDSYFVEKIRDRAVEQRLLELVGNEFKVGEMAETLSKDSKEKFEHLRDRFINSLRLRLKREYPQLTDDYALRISSDIEASLTGYFKKGGLSLATTLFSNGHCIETSELPSSMIEFISKASARYDDLLMRQAFCAISVEAFAKAGSAERDYLGRISQGYFAFHFLGACGDVAIERLKQARDSVWLIDSNAQIPALALAAPTNPIFANCFSRLKESGVRLFTTEKIFNETNAHLTFADKLVKHYGALSYYVYAAAMGEAPYQKSNQFLEGFIRWQSIGNPSEWESYLYHIFGARNPTDKEVKKALSRIGIEVVPFQDWPGFDGLYWETRDEYTERIMKLGADISNEINTEDIIYDELRKKAQPESEALIIVKEERGGTFHILSEQGESSPAWFISSTSILNLEKEARITWQPEAFISFASSLYPSTDHQAAENAFETILWGLAQVGLNLLDEKIVSKVFGGIIDQSALSIREQRDIYKDTLEEKYGEPIESVIARVDPIYRPLAEIQLTKETLQRQSERLSQIETKATEESKRADIAEKKLQQVESFRKKMEGKKKRGKQKNRRQKSKAKRKKKRKKK